MDATREARESRAWFACLCLISTTCTVSAESRPAEEVIATGSRNAFESDCPSPSPAITVDRDSIERRGYNDLQQLMKRLPANGSGAFSALGNNQDPTVIGAASLRDPSADATGNAEAIYRF